MLTKGFLMQALKANLDDFMKKAETQFVIPVYQRNYNWTEKQCKKLLNDIENIELDKDKRAHFIGSIVYVKDEDSPITGIQELIIIDGQQRLTTIILIYLAIYKLLESLNDKSLKNEMNKIYEHYLINKYAQNDNAKIKLKQTNNNNKAIKSILNDERLDDNSYIINNYNYFKDYVNKNNYKKIQNGLKKLIFVEITIKSDDNPQQVFESLNSTGLNLSQADLIRNYILMNLTLKEQNEIYVSYWEYIENLAKDEETNENKMSDFIRDFLTMEYKNIPNKNDVYERFKENYVFKSYKEIKEKIKILKEYASYYNKLINPENEKDREIGEEIKYIKEVEINVSYPFLLKVYKDYEDEVIDKNIFIDVLKTVQSFVWRRFIVDLAPNSLNKTFKNLYSKIDKSKYLYSMQKFLVFQTSKQRFPNDDEVIEKLREKNVYDMKQKNRLYLFERLEKHNNNEKIDFNNSSLTIEHIFPQNPDSKWIQNINKEDYDKMQNKYLHTMSNLTFSGNNGSLGNKIFLEKKNMNKEGKEQGYIYSKLWLNRFLKDINEWDINALETRFTIIRDRFLEIWKYPDIKINRRKKMEYLEVNIFDGYYSKGRKLEYVVFLDEEIKVENISDLFVQVVSILFEKYKNVFFTKSLIKKLKLTKDKIELSSPQKIGDGYFIEGDLKSKDKYEKIKHILEILKLEDELIIKYKS